jgi:hypothetical protein
MNKRNVLDQFLDWNGFLVSALFILGITFSQLH